MRHLIALALLLAVGGCYTPRTFGEFGDRPGWDGLRTSYEVGRRNPVHTVRHDRALRAGVWFDEYTGRASFDLSRPAHVALFALKPFGAIELIYPSWGGARGSYHHAFGSGQHTVGTYSRMYHLTRGHRTDPYYDGSGQTYIILIASDRPLRLGPMLETGTLPWLNHASVTWSPFLATDRLVREIVPLHGSTEWTVAYDVIWPEAALRRYDGRVPRTRVVCPGNSVIWVASEALRNGWYQCPDYTRRPHPNPPTRPTDIARPRSPATPPVRDALPNRPRPTDWQGSTPTRPATARRPAVPSRPAGEVRSRPVTGPRPVPRPQAGSRPGSESRPKAEARARPVSSKPGAASKPAAGSRPAARPAPAKRPKPKAKPGGNGGGGNGGEAGEGAAAPLR